MPVPLKYSVIELERRFLLSELPPGLSRPRRIRDLYIEGTRLRLRTVEDLDGVVLQRKLSHKRRVEEADPTIVNHTNLYLNETESETLSPPPPHSRPPGGWRPNPGPTGITAEGGLDQTMASLGDPADFPTVAPRFDLSIVGTSTV